MPGSEHGSSHIQSLVYCVAKHAKNKHITEILAIVNEILKKKLLEQYKAVEFVSTLCKNFYFYPCLYSTKN